MRLREMQAIIGEELAKLRVVSFGTHVIGNQQVSEVTNWRPAVDAARRLIQVPALEVDVRAFLSAPWAKLGGDPGRIEPAESTKLSQANNTLLVKAEALLAAVNSLLPVLNDAVVAVRLPVMRDLVELKNVANGLHIGISHPANVLFGPCVEFQTFDLGSQWIDLVIRLATDHPTAAAGLGAAGVGSLIIHTKNQVLKFIGQLVDLGFKVARKKQDLELGAQVIRAHTKKNDVLEALAKEAMESLERQHRDDAASIVKGYVRPGEEEKQNEATNVTLAGALAVAELLVRDTQFHVSLPPVADGKAPDATEGAEVKKLWPKPEEIRRALKSAEPPPQLVEKVPTLPHDDDPGN